VTVIISNKFDYSIHGRFKSSIMGSEYDIIGS
jgi:hypothetical protein